MRRRRLASHLMLVLLAILVSAVSMEGANLYGGIDYAKWIGAPGRLEVAGWAADARDGAPVSRIELRLNGRPIGQVQLGLERPDVSKALRRRDFLRSGWSAQVTVTGFAPGRYKLTALARNRRGESQELGGATLIEIGSLGGATQPAAGLSTTLEGSVDTVRLSPSGRTLDLAGWAADRKTGAPVAKVEVRLSDRVVAIARLGLARPDVAGALRRSNYLHSGWTAQIDVTGFRRGTYELSVHAWNVTGEKFSLPNTTRTLQLR